MELTINNVPYIRFQVCGLDVWGNKRDGFDVNDVYPQDLYITVPKEWTSRDIIKALKNADVIVKNCRYSSFAVVGETYYLHVEYVRDGMPILGLRNSEFLSNF